MIELILGFIITITSLLVGYSLGKHQVVVTPDFKKQMTQIFQRVAPRDATVGAVPRPTAQQNFYRDHPEVAQEHEIMSREFEELQK